MQITLNMLTNASACSSQVKEFKKRFGTSVEVTEELCLSLAHVFDFSWAAHNFLRAPALAEYEKVRDSALAEYERVRAAMAEYEKVCAAMAEYEKVCAVAFAKAYLQWSDLIAK